MTTSNNKPTVETMSRLEPPHDIASITTALWEQYSANLSDQELKWFAQADEKAETYFQNLEQVIEGIGALVGTDYITHSMAEDGIDKPIAGSFQTPQSISALLNFLGDSVRQGRALSSIASSAAFRLRSRELVRAKQ